MYSFNVFMPPIGQLMPSASLIRHYLAMVYYFHEVKEKKIYNRIKANLALYQVKNKVLAEQLQVSPQTVSKWCTNQSQPSIPQLYAIAIFLNVPIANLLELPRTNFKSLSI